MTVSDGIVNGAERTAVQELHRNGLNAIVEIVLRPAYGDLAERPLVLAYALHGTSRRILGTLGRVMPTVLQSWRDLADGDAVTRVVDLAEYSDERVDVLFDDTILGFIERPQDALANAVRVVRKGGFVVLGIKSHRLIDGDQVPTVAYRLDATKYGLPPGTALPSMRIGRKWVPKVLERYGCASLPAASLACPVEDGIEWFIGRRGARSEDRDEVAPAASDAPVVESKDVRCTICGGDLSEIPSGSLACPNCRSRPRTRTLVPLCDEHVRPLLLHSESRKCTLLAFAMTKAEERVLRPLFGTIRSVSLYGSYRHEHEEGVDVRDLKRFGSGSFDAVFGSLLFDYFEEHEVALAEVARVLRPGGLMFTHLASYRLRDDDSGPTVSRVIRKRDGYFEYVPDDARLPSITVGRSWFLDAVERAGLAARHVELVDRISREVIEWFVGVKGSYPSLGSASPGGVARAPLPVSTRLRRLAKKAYSIPVHGFADLKRITLELSVPPLPSDLADAGFVEHVFDAETGASTDTIIVGGIGCLGVSEDLGVSWRRIPLERAKGVRIVNSFTTRTGRHLAQCAGWRGPGDRQTECSMQGRIFVLDANWEMVGESQPGRAAWHGTASVGQSGSTIMFGEYHTNSVRSGAGGGVTEAERSSLPRSNSIFRSTDEGSSWQKVLEVPPSVIRHFHTVVPDPHQTGWWWASSGDRASECRVWCSRDDGDTWREVTNPAPGIDFPTKAGLKQSCFRFTDLVVGREWLWWGADDILGRVADANPELPRGKRPGSRLYRTRRTSPLEPEEFGYIGNPVRKIVDVGQGFLIITEAKISEFGLRPEVVFLRRDLGRLHRLIHVDNYKARPTGFTYSKGSRMAKNGVFFTYRTSADAFPCQGGILKWTIQFE